MHWYVLRCTRVHVLHCAFVLLSSNKTKSALVPEERAAHAARGAGRNSAVVLRSYKLCMLPMRGCTRINRRESGRLRALSEPLPSPAQPVTKPSPCGVEGLASPPPRPLEAPDSPSPPPDPGAASELLIISRHHSFLTWFLSPSHPSLLPLPLPLPSSQIPSPAPLPTPLT